MSCRRLAARASWRRAEWCVGLKLDDGEMFERLLEEETIPLEAGDLYVFFTDGISEAMNSADDCFGEVRLGQLVEDHADLPPDELRERVLREVRSFVDGAPQHDDMTMILLRVEELPQPPRRRSTQSSQSSRRRLITMLGVLRGLCVERSRD